MFAEAADGALEFHPADPPSDEDVARLLATIRRRVLRLLARRGLGVGDTPDVDPLTEESPALAGISTASIQGRVALGPRAGARVIQIGREPDAPWVTSRGPRQAHLQGFDLHADISVAADDRSALERLTRYVLRPPVAQDRLTLTPEGKVLLTLKSEWADGTSHLLFEPIEFLEKLAALTPRPPDQPCHLSRDPGPACPGTCPSRRPRCRRIPRRRAVRIRTTRRRSSRSFA